MIKNIIIIGSGLISKKHNLALKKIQKKVKLKKISSRQFEKFKKEDFKKLNILKPRLIIICSPATKHYINFKQIEKNFENINVLIEKPVFEKFYKIKKKLKNNYYVGYNLRFHPVILFLKKFLKNKKIFSINITSHSYLPKWRKIDYRKSVSAKKKLGGGILLELSHEFDYLKWIFKEIKILHSFNKRVSRLQIETDDILNLTGQVNKKTLFNLNMNFFSTIITRLIKIDGNNFSLNADLMKNEILIVKGGRKINKKFLNFSMQKTYEYQLSEVLSNKISNICSLNEGLEVIKLIEKIKRIKSIN